MFRPGGGAVPNNLPHNGFSAHTNVHKLGSQIITVRSARLVSSSVCVLSGCSVIDILYSCTYLVYLVYEEFM